MVKCWSVVGLFRSLKYESKKPRPKGIRARKEFVQLAQLNDVYFVQKREKEISKKLLTSERFGGKLDLSSRTETKAQHFEN